MPSETSPGPTIEDHVVEPEITRNEMIRGEIVWAAPANPPHGDRHVDLAYVIRASIADGYVASVDLLSRTSRDWNFATDCGVRKAGIDESTGVRFVEELSFEIKSTQSVRDLTDRARELIRAGVRRVFGIWVSLAIPGDEQSVRAGPVKEWSPERDDWIELDPDSAIDDPCFARPLKVRALINQTEADNQVARALIAQQNPVLATLESNLYEQGKSEGHERGKGGLRLAIAALCDAFDIELTPERQADIDARSLDELEALLESLQSRRAWPA